MEIFTIVMTLLTFVLVAIFIYKPIRLMGVGAMGMSTLGLAASLIDTTLTDTEMLIQCVMMVMMVMITGTLIVSGRMKD